MRSFLFALMILLCFSLKGKTFDVMNDRHQTLYFSILPGLKNEVSLVSGFFKYDDTSYEISEQIQYNGIKYTVVEIGYKAFYGRKNLTQIKLPNTIRKINDYAFAATSLKTFDIPDSLFYVSNLAFHKSLVDIDLIQTELSNKRYNLKEKQKRKARESLDTEFRVSISDSISNGWKKENFPADDLLGTAAYNAYVYSDAKCSFVFWSNNLITFRVNTNNTIKDVSIRQMIQDGSMENVHKCSSEYESYLGEDFSDHGLAIIGCYDIDNNLIEKYTLLGHIGSKSSERIEFPCPHILKFLKSQKGFVRIVIDYKYDYSKADIKIPCLMNN